MIQRCAGISCCDHLVRGSTICRPLAAGAHPLLGAPTRIKRLDFRRRLDFSKCRWASTSTSHAIQNVAILGGGITGLAAAHYITEELPHVKVTIFESKPVLGGWLRSKTVDVGDDEVIFESGPRSLRPGGPNGSLTLRLIQKLGLIDDVLATPRTSAAARNRYIYHPDRLIRMPAPGRDEIVHNFRTVFQEPAFAGALETLAERGVFGSRPPVPEDESIGEFLSKRIGQGATNNLASALYHGIYAGDIWQLSAKSVLSLFYELEKRHQSLGKALFDTLWKKETWAFADDTELQMKVSSGGWPADFREKMQGASVYTFKRGIGQLVESLQRSLARKENVTFASETLVTNMEKEPTSDDVRISHQPTTTADPSTKTTNAYTHVISTLRGPLLTALLTAPASTTPTPTQPTLSQSTTTALTSTPTVTVCVVNLYFRTPHLLRTLTPPNTTLAQPLQGFGYLIPNSISLDANPERALGVIFDSDISPALHSTLPHDKVGTRLTVMLGGHWWDGWSDYPDEEDSIAMARLLLERHLGLSEEPVVARATLQRDCISQYTIGHTRRMAEAHRGLLGAFGGRVRMAGSAFGVAGVGVNDCVRGAWDVVNGLAEGGVRGGKRTGLEKFEEGRPMVRTRRSGNEVLVVGMDEDVRKLGYFKND